jgi:hypothetical protein
VEVAVVRGPASKECEKTAGRQSGRECDTQSGGGTDELHCDLVAAILSRARCVLAGAIASVASDGLGGADLEPR